MATGGSEPTGRNAPTIAWALLSWLRERARAAWRAPRGLCGLHPEGRV